MDSHRKIGIPEPDGEQKEHSFLFGSATVFNWIRIHLEAILVQLFASLYLSFLLVLVE